MRTLVPAVLLAVMIAAAATACSGDATVTIRTLALPVAESTHPEEFTRAISVRVPSDMS